MAMPRMRAPCRFHSSISVKLARVAEVHQLQGSPSWAPGLGIFAPGHLRARVNTPSTSAMVGGPADTFLVTLGLDAATCTCCRPAVVHAHRSRRRNSQGPRQRLLASGGMWLLITFRGGAWRRTGGRGPV